MVLRSQVARQGIRLRYMSGGSRRRRSLFSRWPWAVLSLLIVAGVVMAVWSGKGRGTDSNAGNTIAKAAGAKAVATSTADVKQGTSARPTETNAGQGSTASSAAPASKTPVWTLDGTSVKTKPSVAQTTSPHQSPTSTASKASSGAPGAVNPPSSAQALAKLMADSDSNHVTAGGSDVEAGFSLIEQGKRVAGRKLLSRLLLDGSLTPAQAQKTRDVLTIVNNTLIYSPQITPAEPLTEQYVVKAGDRLVNIAIKFKTPHQFIEKINGIDPNRIRVGQRIKVVKGPFHAIVSKSAFRMDVYLKDPADGQMLYVRSFPVGLGTDDSTPLGRWVVRPRSKVVNPGWTNPRTNAVFTRDDPRNPVGEFWMGLEGVSAATANLQGYGIHGTIEPDSIGTQSSMGCIRLRDEDIAQVFHMFWEGETTVQIVK